MLFPFKVSGDAILCVIHCLEHSTNFADFKPVLIDAMVLNTNLLIHVHPLQSLLIRLQLLNLFQHRLRVVDLSFIA